MRKRKLITGQTLDNMLADLDRGVPLTRAMSNAKLSMSRPAVAKLLKAYQISLEREELTKLIQASLFPPWLDFDGQEEPEHYSYEGFFPYGVWTSVNENN